MVLSENRHHRRTEAGDGRFRDRALVGEFTMGITRDHRRCAEECVAMARASENDSDKALWLTLAQSWVRLAEHVARGGVAEHAEDALAVQSSD
jgi:hypothetical protein